MSAYQFSDSGIETLALGLSQQVDDDLAGTIYVGYAAPGSSTSTAVWALKKIVTSGGATSIAWAGGTNLFSFKWTLRATYTYS